MLGMMNKGGGSTNMPAGGAVPGAPMQAGMQQAGMGPAGGMPSKGGGTQNMPVPGAGGGAGLASLFMNNRPMTPGAGPATLPTITAPQHPAIVDPVRRTPQQPAAPAQAPVFHNAQGGTSIRTRADLGNYMQMFPNRTDVRENFNRGPGNYWGRNGGHGGSR
jgi:hypothetical protein